MKLTATVHDGRRVITIRDIFGEMGFPEARIPWFCHNRGGTQAASQVGVGGRTKRVNI